MEWLSVDAALFVEEAVRIEETDAHTLDEDEVLTDMLIDCDALVVEDLLPLALVDARALFVAEALSDKRLLLRALDELLEAGVVVRVGVGLKPLESVEVGDA